MLASPQGSLPARSRFFQAIRRWRNLIALIAPAALLAQSTLNLTIERAGHEFTLHQSQGPGQGFASSALTLEMNNVEPDEDGLGGFHPTSMSRLLATTAQSVVNDYYISDDSTGENSQLRHHTDPNFVQTEFNASSWPFGFFLALPSSRAGHLFSYETNGRSFNLTTTLFAHHLGF